MTNVVEAVSRIAQHAFQIHDVALRQVEVVADPDRGVNVHGQMQRVRLPERGSGK